jgi:hypothetical protein
MIETSGGHLQPEKHIPPKRVYRNTRNLEHKYEAIKAQFTIKVNGAQSSIEKKNYTPKGIGS